ncbi:phosphoglycerate mutase family protein [Aspergillus melleus]|uniref:phosphoglycerate mutase family protein n=1 Tax=Aspergillus melleus TaxID=138277 RepID=UPI001E8E2D29|nr:putative phosphoglycerate mutase pmu1 [Aspergillus melleus]KAH8425899.1 putative phosphoglycerate mutase pmu1 [Aspergillus melleus]
MKPSTFVSVALSLATTASSYTDCISVAGCFLQDDDETDYSTFDLAATNFGLINRTYDADEQSPTDTLTQWQQFYNQVVHLNDESPSNVNYNVLSLGRHGQGWHNAADQYYGWPAWNCYWSLINGNGTASWRDSRLTDGGVAQAQPVHGFWKKLIDTQHIYTPDSYLVSPLTRTLQTANVTFSTLSLPRGSGPFRPLIHELFRESINIQTCNMRSSRSYIHNLFPDWPISPDLDGFSYLSTDMV